MQKARSRALAAETLKLERTLSDPVNQAYALTPTEIDHWLDCVRRTTGDNGLGRRQNVLSSFPQSVTAS